jgi:hypothetical protein
VSDLNGEWSRLAAALRDPDATVASLERSVQEATRALNLYIAMKQAGAVVRELDVAMTVRLANATDAVLRIF